MSDRKCKSAGATDTQPRNTKGARCRPSIHCAAPPLSPPYVSIPSWYSLSLSAVPVNIFTTKIHALCSRVRVADYSSWIGPRSRFNTVLNSAKIASRSLRPWYKFIGFPVWLISAEIARLVNIASRH